MDNWAALWAGLLLISLALFAGLAATVSVGAWFDLRRMLKRRPDGSSTGSTPSSSS